MNTRILTIDFENADSEKRVAPAVLSTETPVYRKQLGAKNPVCVLVHIYISRTPGLAHASPSYMCDHVRSGAFSLTYVQVKAKLFD